MKRSLLLFVFVCFLDVLVGSSIYAQTPQPTPNPQYRYYCLNETALPLSATPSGGGTLRWYTTATGGGFTTTAPVPPTNVAASDTPLIYYVTQVIGSLESTPRTPIYVYVDQKLNLYCQTRTTNSITFDFANTGQTSFTYSYTVDGGTPQTGTHTAPTNFTVSGLNEGQTVVYTLTAVGAKACVTPESTSCTTICSSLSTPAFTQIAPICTGDTAPVLPSSSIEGIEGTWSPAVVSNTSSGTYVFTPNANECADTQSMTIAVNPASPGFSDFSICSGNSVPNLDTTSPTGVTGTWNPATIDNVNTDSYTFTPDAGQCTASQIINVTVIPSDRLTDFNWEVTTAFAENQKITVSAIAPADDYLYQLDEGPFQSSPVFENVASGTHSITVVDQGGCSMPITKNDIVVINYPKFFTPNNDGFNDYWNIKELSSQPSAYIRIFDRYGKFLKQISPNGDGWNGSYNGYFLPADDYWFVVHYIENETVKEFKSHFALKR
ncbi:T9SS type B sorting domain-containing protein [Flavobacterium sp. FBOR7N2.3]|uniref:T9SS type B sorting domain-containing protein n=1 Tax=Flavobacterium magnesitis TaxID=3138077 RepID=A0ABV4TLY6_9FLAO